MRVGGLANKEIGIMKTMILAALGAVMMAMPATAQPTCFSMRDFQTWKAPDARTIYIKVSMNHYYRLDLSAPCAGLKWVGVHLVTKSRGSDQVCDALDWDITASTKTFGQPGGMQMKCIVKKMTPMTDAEMAALPKGSKP
jgi:hypothetical protein